MSQSYFLEERPPMWWLEAADADAHAGVDADSGVDVVTGDDVLRLGNHAVRLSDIRSYRLEEIAERDFEGLLLNAVIFFIGGSIFLIGVLQFGWLERFLIGFVFLFILGMAGLGEVMGLNTIRYMRLTVHTQAGRRVHFTSPDPRDMTRLVTFLDQIVRR